MNQTQYTLTEKEKTMFIEIAQSIKSIQDQANTMIQGLQDKANGMVTALAVAHDLDEGGYILSEDFTVLNRVEDNKTE